METQLYCDTSMAIYTTPPDKVDVAGGTNKCYICTLWKETGSGYKHVEPLEAALTCCAIMLKLRDAQCSMAHVQCACDKVYMF